ncbi:MAG: c-type cytochrome [Chitinophagaceae bacterium]
MKKLIVAGIAVLLMAACGSNDGEKKAEDAKTSATESVDPASANPSYDPKRGEGKFSDVKIAASLDQEKAATGEKLFAVKCSSCHKLTDEKLVGPGWKGVTSRHSVEWIMNFSTNPDVMIDKDPKAQAMLELCLVRMPNQNLSDDDARNIYEFMRKNDGVK